MSGPKQYREWQPRQSFLLPPSPLEWLEPDHLAYFILDLVDELDLSAIEDAIHSKDARGTRPYSPRMMTALLLYAYSVGLYSSRKIERATREHVAFRVLSGGSHPFFTTIHEFRSVHAEALSSLFDQVLELCQKAGLVKLTHVAVDGTKVQANASKHKAMSYARMVEEETAIQKQVREWFRLADEADAEEDARYGVGKREHDLPEELRRREDRLRLIRQWKKELEEEARASRAAELQEQAERARQRTETEPRQKVRRANRSRAKRCDEQAQSMSPVSLEDFVTPTGLPKHRVRARPDGTPHPKAQWNFVDSESRIMERGGTFLQGYNCQLAVDSAHQIIVAQAVTNQCPDNGNLLPMLEQVEANCGKPPTVVTADAGYWSPEVPSACQTRGTDVYIAPDRKKSRSDRESYDESGGEAKLVMRKKLQTDEGREIYARRKAIIEPVNGQIKEARGFRRFSVRGLPKVGRQWSLVCTAHNLLKLFASTRAAVPAV